MHKLWKKAQGAIAPAVLVITLSSFSMAQPSADDKGHNQSRETNATEWYAGIGLSTVKAVCVDNCEDITFGVIGKAGYDVNQYIGIEGRVIKTFWEYEQQKVEHVGLFVKPMLPITEDLHAYGLLGYAKTKTGDIKTFDESGLAWGVGVNYYLENDKDALSELEQKLSVLERQADQKLGTPEEQRLRRAEIQKVKEKIDAFDENRLGVFFDYERLIQKSDAPDLDALNLGVTYDF